ncbi:MAG: hypothetical protein ACYC3I_26200 [Gemmataceae bacterium]
MSSYYIRYKSGDCEAVCRELVNHGKNVTEPLIYADAIDVSRELVDRSFKNLDQLLRRLRDLGYLFEHSEDALVEVTPSDLSALEVVESDTGALPIVVRKWYERIKSVDFTQQEAQLFSKQGSPCGPVSGLGLHIPLVFLSIPKCLLLQEQLCKQAVGFGDDPSKFKNFLPLGGWGSNSDPKGFWLPCKSFDTKFYNEGGGGVYFVEELRTAFKWGGFPFWRRLLTGKKQAQPLRCVPSFETILPILTDGLLPI